MRLQILSFALLLSLSCQPNQTLVADSSSEAPGSRANGPVVLAVVPFDTDDGPSELKRFSMGLAALTRSFLMGYERIQLVDPLGIHQVPDNEAYRRKLQQLGARFLLTGEMEYEDGKWDGKPD